MQIFHFTGWKLICPALVRSVISIGHHVVFEQSVLRKTFNVKALQLLCTTQLVLLQEQTVEYLNLDIHLIALPPEQHGPSPLVADFLASQKRR